MFVQHHGGAKDDGEVHERVAQLGLHLGPAKDCLGVDGVRVIAPRGLDPGEQLFIGSRLRGAAPTCVEEPEVHDPVQPRRR
ncbi:MAG TPA: hypothetical protein VHM65_06510 [Candidatus Lustribacter sp.]|nr:hypothetical protein [Candidatus Lustribacter sp.]